jgi:hypothetical protein
VTPFVFAQFPPPLDPPVANGLRSHEELGGDREKEIRKLEVWEKKTENKGKWSGTKRLMLNNDI